MSGFNPLVLKWDGETKVIQPHHMLRAIAAVEEIITLHEIGIFQKRGTAPMARIAQAYGALLRYAGFQVSDDEVYAGMFADQGMAGATAVAFIHQVMVPPESMLKAALKGQSEPGKSVEVEDSLSKASIKQPSQGSGSRRKSSGG